MTAKETGDVAAPEKAVKSGGNKKSPPVKSKHLISLSEYKTLSEYDITSVLEHGFRTWMLTDKKQPLRSRTKSDWDNLFAEYLKS